VYVIALTQRTDTVAGALPVAAAWLQELLGTRPKLRLDKAPRPTTAAELGERLAGFWLPDETVLYIGLTTRPLATRLGEFYGHRLGAKSPHKGGWPLKTLSVLDELWVHWAATARDDCAAAERAMLHAFAAGVSATSKRRLYEPEPLMPFANLRDGDHQPKRHGITGPTGPLPARS
jgi:hypothetical protein